MDQDRLLLVTGEGLFSTYDLTDHELVIGRGHDCDIAIPHRALSRRHAVVRGGRQARVADLGSTSGTHIAGAWRRSGDEHELALGDSFQIGPFSFLLVTADAIPDRSTAQSGFLRVPDPTLRGVPALLADVARGSSNVLILGETGVGKEVLAETVHQLSGRPGPLVRIDCAAATAAGLEGDALASAAGGAILLDEIAELPLALQTRLLAVVERRGARFIATTNRELAAEVAALRFRRDLYYRLEEITLTIPPLRQRPGMIARLARTFLDEGRELTRAALVALEIHTWPGNVRELRSVMTRAALRAGAGAPIDAEHLSLDLSLDSRAPDDDDGERERVLAALDACAGNQTRAAKMLGIGRTTMLRRLNKFQIPRPRPTIVDRSPSLRRGTSRAAG